MSCTIKEHSHVSTLPFLGGVELLHARFVTQSFSRHFHEGFAIGCIESGAMRFNYLGESVVASKGQVNLVVPGEVHDGHGANRDGWAYRMFYLQPEALMTVARSLMKRPALPNFRMGVIADPGFAGVIAQTHRLMESPDVPTLEKETQLLSLLTRWVNQYADDHGYHPKHGTEHNAVNRARDIIEDRFAEDISLTELARLAGLSPYHLTRVFEKRLGISPHTYLTQTRIKRARERLSGTDRIADIALDCGFSDQSHLTRLFKKQTGITPGKYRNILQNN
ncbi:AraC family transcriptional regulator [uncultured Pseudodesulfovibrio sp.]|uniref:AraC family transcriptional regulator n=1 Tax=uncultured Pseudodesulfovibrio sp. TaxID=2035858 RepID=UPI0029C87EB3|nr:AraC family transcriptional regulator [uncultured Pseudodesulfovibrio sp.]